MTRQMIARALTNSAAALLATRRNLKATARDISTLTDRCQTPQLVELAEAEHVITGVATLILNIADVYGPV